ncbi:MAG: translation elongation factor Ts [Candidatus Kapabacteria bacterium]|nr:translation elongation factor Ts [Candidatus Kapabacteria bacterium]
MLTITPQMVKELRDKTNAGMGDCKKALTESDGDMQTAVEILRKKGAASASKRSDRVSKEGLICIRTKNDGKEAIIVEVNSETDFVARNAEFERYANICADAMINSNASTVDELMNEKVGDDTVLGIHNEILAKFSENIQVRRVHRLKSEGYIADYLHAGSKLGVLVEFSCNNVFNTGVQPSREIAMQVAAMNPSYVERANVTQATIDKEIEIYRQQIIDSGKTGDLVDRIAVGKLEKFYQEQCLVEQAFVKDASKTIKDVVADMGKACGCDLKINSFNRFLLGED